MRKTFSPTGSSSREHDGEAPDRLPPEHDRGVLPVAVELLDVDILVGEVDAAGKAGVAVDDADLAVVAVVHPQVDNRDEGVEDAGPDAVGLQQLVIPVRELENRTQVVIDDPDVDPFGGFAAEDREDRVPHCPLLQDEVLEEDVVLRLFQLLKHPLPAHLAGGVVFAGGAAVRRAVGPPLDIMGLQAGVGLGRHHLFQHRLIRLVIPHHILGDLGHLFAGMAGKLVEAEQQVKGPAKNRQRHNQDNPGDFIGGVGAAGDDREDGHQAAKEGNAVENHRIMAETEEKEGEHRDLDNQ